MAVRRLHGFDTPSPAFLRYAERKASGISTRWTGPPAEYRINTTPIPQSDGQDFRMSTGDVDDGIDDVRRKTLHDEDIHFMRLRGSYEYDDCDREFNRPQRLDYQASVMGYGRC